MPFKTNQELGIYKISSDLKPIIEELQDKDQINLRDISINQKAKLGRLAKKTGIIELVSTIIKTKQIQIVKETDKKIIIQTEV